MGSVFVLGGTKPGYHKRYLRAVKVLSELFDIVYYQYADYSDDIPFDLPSNVVPLPVKLDKSKLKGKHRIDFEREVKDIFNRYGKSNGVYLLDFLRFYPLYPFKHARKVVFETFEYYPAGVLYSIPSYVLGKLKEWAFLPIYLKMLDVSDGIVATVPRDMFPANKILPNVRNKTFYIPNLAATTINPLPVSERRKAICFGATRKMSLFMIKEIVHVWEKHGFAFDVYGGATYHDISGRQYQFLPYDEYMVSLSKCYGFIVTTVLPGYSPNINEIWTLPNKLFDTLGAGTPVLVHESNIAMAEFVNKYGVGLVYGDRVSDKDFDMFMSKYNNFLSNIRKYQGYFVWNKTKEQRYKRFLESVYGG